MRCVDTLGWWWLRQWWCDGGSDNFSNGAGYVYSYGGVDNDIMVMIK